MTLDATRLTRLHRVGAVALSPDGTWLAVQVARLDDEEKRYVCDLWRISVTEPPAAPPHRLTHGDFSDTAPRFRRDGALAFLSDRPRPGCKDDGERRPQVWILPAAGGEPVPLTDEPLGVSDFRFARAADRLAVIADVLPGVPHDEQRERARRLATAGPTGLRYRTMPVRFWDHWLGLAAPHLVVYDEEGGGRRDLTPEADAEYRPVDLDVRWDVSADGRRAALPARRCGADRAAEVSLHVIDLDTGARAEVGREDGAMYAGPVFSPDGAQLAAVRHLRRPGAFGRMTLQLVRLGESGAPGAPRELAAHWDAWPEVEAWTADGRALVVTADLEGRRPVFSVDAASGEVTRVTAEAAGGVHGGLTIGAGPGGAPVAFGVRSTILHPPEPFRVDLAPGAGPALLACLSGMSPEEGAALAGWESFDTSGAGGERVQSFLVRPRGVERPPVLMFIHGGPMSQHVDGWHWRWNPLVATGAGYAVALPNPRGSTGRGQAFVEGVWDNKWGEACYQDLMAVADALERRADLDGARMAALGGSFGGYMANWIGGQTDRFRALVTHASIYHFSAFHGATDEPSFFALELGGTPYADPEAFDRYSPHRFVDRWKTPTLIIHGEKDYRVPVSEGLILFEALQLHGVESELLVFPDENHWIARPQNARQWYEAVLEFVGRFMG